MSLPLRGRVEDQAPRRVHGRAVSDAGEGADLRSLLRHGSRHQRPPAAANRDRRQGKTSIDSAGIARDGMASARTFSTITARPRSADDAAQAAYERLARAAERTYNDFREKAENYLQANTDDIVAYFGALDRFENDKERHQQAAVPEAAPLGPDDGAAARGRQVDQGPRGPGIGVQEQPVQPVGRAAGEAGPRARRVGIRSAGTAWSRSISP